MSPNRDDAAYHQAGNSFRLPKRTDTMTTDPERRFRENVTEITATLVTGIWLAALFTGQSWWIGALIFGYVVAVPLVAEEQGDERDRAEWWD